jgi:hypothetical protein
LFTHRYRGYHYYRSGAVTAPVGLNLYGLKKFKFELKNEKKSLKIPKK